MRKKLSKKLVLKKVTITSLNENDMYLIRGATLVHHCTESCSLVHICCDPKTNPLDEGNNLAKDQG